MAKLNNGKCIMEWMNFQSPYQDNSQYLDPSRWQYDESIHQYLSLHSRHQPAEIFLIWRGGMMIVPIGSAAIT